MNHAFILKTIYYILKKYYETKKEKYLYELKTLGIIINKYD
jgi:hypothetical protein